MDTLTAIGVDFGLPATVILSTGERWRGGSNVSGRLAQNYLVVCTEARNEDFPSFCSLFDAIAKACRLYQKQHLSVPWYYPSTRICNICLKDGGRLHPNIKAWTCQYCEAPHDRDINAAVNIKREALRLLAMGYYART